MADNFVEVPAPSEQLTTRPGIERRTVRDAGGPVRQPFTQGRPYRPLILGVSPHDPLVMCCRLEPAVVPQHHRDFRTISNTEAEPRMTWWRARQRARQPLMLGKRRGDGRVAFDPSLRRFRTRLRLLDLLTDGRQDIVDLPLLLVVALDAAQVVVRRFPNGVVDIVADWILQGHDAAQVVWSTLSPIGFYAANHIVCVTADVLLVAVRCHVMHSRTMSDVRCGLIARGNAAADITCIFLVRLSWANPSGLQSSFSSRTSVRPT